MTLHYNRTRNQVVCRWHEPKRVVLDKKTKTINRIKSIIVNLNKNGQPKSDAVKKHSHLSIFKYARMFGRELSEKGILGTEQVIGVCGICGAREQVEPGFDMERKRIVWRCPLHRYLK